MLASLLPGVRDLRNPLAVGYTLFIAGWLIFRDHVPSKDDATGVAARLYELSGVFGTTATLAALSFLAYMFGSVVLVSRTPRWILRFGWLGRGKAASEVNADVEVLGRARFTAAHFRGRTGEAGLHALMPDASVAELEHFDEQTRAEEIAQYFNRRVEMETYGAVSRLQVKSPPLYDAYDRRMAEAELRLSIFCPLVLLVGVLTFQWTPWAAFLVVVPLVLAYQGARKEVAARTLLAEAYRDGLVESSTMERLDVWFKERPAPSPVPKSMDAE